MVETTNQQNLNSKILTRRGMQVFETNPFLKNFDETSKKKPIWN